MRTAPTAWPELNYSVARETLNTLHLMTQIAGKLKLSHMPRLNHSWHATFYVSARGLTSSGVCHGSSKFQIDFDFIDHSVSIAASDGRREIFSLIEQPIADFWRHFQSATQRLGLEFKSVPRPNEVVDAIPFAEDRIHARYQPEYVEAFWRVLLRTDNILQQFRAEFTGKCSPVHFFWGSFDLACTRFSGRAAPEHPGGVPHLADAVTKEAYSHEVCSCGFWPGSANYPHASFYSYAYPEPQDFAGADLGIDGAFYHQDLHEFILPYEKVIHSPFPARTIYDFFQRAYRAAASLAQWDTANLELNPYLNQLQSQYGGDTGLERSDTPPPGAIWG